MGASQYAISGGTCCQFVPLTGNITADHLVKVILPGFFTVKLFSLHNKNLVEDTLSLNKYPVFHPCPLTNFNIHWWFLLETIITLEVANAGFLIPSFLPYLLVGILQ